MSTNYEYKEIEEKFKSLPRDIQMILTSVEISTLVKRISDKHDLLMDQASILFDLVSDILLGFLPSKDFVSSLSKEANLSEKTSFSIAKDVNKEIFDGIRSSMQKMDNEMEERAEASKSTSHSSPLEQAGNMEIIEENAVEKEGGNEHVDPIPDHMISAPEWKIGEKPAPVKENIEEEKDENTVDGVSFTDRYREPVE